MRACTLGYVSSSYGGLTAAVVLTVYGAAASKLRDVKPYIALGKHVSLCQTGSDNQTAKLLCSMHHQARQSEHGWAA